MEKKWISMIIVILSLLTMFQYATPAYANTEQETEVEHAYFTIEAGSEDHQQRALEEEIIEEVEAGGALLLMSDADNMVSSASIARSAATVTLEVGEAVYYMGWSTHYFYINGKLAYCLEPSKGTPSSGDYAATVLANNELLAKALYYLVGGPGYTSALEQQFFPDTVGDFASNYCYSHVILSYIYDGCSTGGDAFKGVTDDLIQQVISVTNMIKNMEDPPSAELSITPSYLESSYVESDDLQKTGSFTLSGDSRNYITITLPGDVTIHNVTTGKTATGSAQVKGGDQFYFTAPTAITGTWETGDIYGTITNEYKAIVFNQGSSDQAIGGWSYTIGGDVAPVSFSVKWLDYGQIKLTKVSADKLATEDGVDDSYYTLKGAEYEVTDKNGEVVDTITTDASGYGISKKLPYGKYTVTEKTSSVGYLVDVTSHTVLLSAEEAAVTSTEKTQYGKIELKKLDSETSTNSPQGAATLEGAVYEIYNSAGVLVETVTTDRDGEAVSSKHPLGNYMVREKSPSQGYLIDETVYEVEIKSTDRTTTIFTKTVTSREDIIRGDIQLVKFKEDKDTEVEIKTPLEGIQFTVTSKTTGKVVKTITTDKDGYASTADDEHPRGGLVYDTYIVEEVAATVPSGVKTIEPFEVTISEEGVTHHYIIEDKIVLSPITVVKVDGTTGKVIPVADTEFRLLDSNKEPIIMITYYPNKVEHETFMTDESGSFTFPEKLSTGIYYLEEVQAPEGYLKGELLQIEITEGHLWDEPYVVEYEDTPAMGQIYVHKTDGETEANLEGAEFTITAKEDIVTADGTVRLEAGEVADVITSDKNGMAVSKELFLGLYEIEETKVPAGYVKPASTKTIELKYENQEVAVVTEVVEVVNQPTKITLVKLRQGSEDTTLAGVEFAFWNKLSVQVEGMDKEVLVTDENGEITLQYLSPGTYCFQETATLPGYLLSADIYEITVDENGYIDGQRVGELVIENDYTKVTFSKQEVTGEQEIEGAEMEVTDPDGKVIESWTSGKEPYVIEELVPGTYILKESLAPIGYLVSNEVEFEVMETGEVQQVVMYDEVPMGRLLIHKVDEETQTALVGVEFELRDPDGKVLETLTTDESGKAESQLYPIGTYEDGTFIEHITYTVIESKALDGYELDLTIHEVVFEYVDGNTPLIEVGLELTNKQIPEEPEEPDEAEESQTPNDSSTQSSSPKTGDTTVLVPFLAALAGSGAITGRLLYRRRKKK
ncbi:MAG: SpaA isopeptide-forming pilin-related protein [Lachnospiraceae bacterium]